VRGYTVHHRLYSKELRNSLEGICILLHGFALCMISFILGGPGGWV
jgi:hypothetical protein